MNNDTAFTCFKIAGVQFLAIPQYEGSVMVIDSFGHNYGGWMNTAMFKKNFIAGEKAKTNVCSLGVCRLIVSRA